jgi:DNA-binding LytR/AlgR family response regulator
VDDEPLAIEVLQTYVEQLEQLVLVDTFRNPVKAFEFLQKNSVDIVFMDIQMPGLTGLDIVRSLNDQPAIIITTAYREYALDGYELDVVDYLLKPVAFDRFLVAVQKADKQRNTGLTGEVKVPHQTPDSLFVKVDKKKVKVCPDKVLYMESQGDNLKLVCGDQTIKTQMTMQEAEQVFSTMGFVRIHRSFLVNCSHINSYSHSEMEINNHNLPIGRHYRNEVIKILDNLASL